MLDFARVDAGRLALLVVELDPEALCWKLLNDCRGWRLNDFNWHPILTGICLIRVDASRVHQCFAALVENSLRYSDGFVQLGVETLASLVREGSRPWYC